MPGGALRDLPGEASGSQFLDVKQVQKMLKIGRSTLFGLMKRTKDPLPSVRIGKSRRVPLDKLRWWMENLHR